MTLTKTMTKDKFRKAGASACSFWNLSLRANKKIPRSNGFNFAGSDSEQDSRGCTDHNMSPDIRKMTSIRIRIPFTVVFGRQS
jgi:hypothetical protein